MKLLTKISRIIESSNNMHQHVYIYGLFASRVVNRIYKHPEHIVHDTNKYKFVYVSPRYDVSSMINHCVASLALDGDYSGANDNSGLWEVASKRQRENPSTIFIVDRVDLLINKGDDARELVRTLTGIGDNNWAGLIMSSLIPMQRIPGYDNDLHLTICYQVPCNKL